MRAIFFAVSLGVTLSGCVSNDIERKENIFDSSFATVDEDVTGNEGELSFSGENPIGVEPLKMQTLPSMVPSGNTSKDINLSIDAVVFDDKELVSFSADEMPLDKFINYALADILDVNFVLDPKLGSLEEQTVTLNLEEKVTKQAFYKIFVDTLVSHDISLVKKDKLFFVYKASNRGHFDKIRIGIGKYQENIPADGEIVYQLVPIDFVDGAEVKRFVTQVTLATANVMGDGNYLLVQGYKNDVSRALKVIEYMDVPASVGRYIQFIPLSYVEPFEFIDNLKELLLIEGINFGVSIKATPLPRHNGIVVHSKNAELIERVLFWKQKLDSASATGKLRYMLYFPQNSKASELGKGITRLLSLESGGTARTSSSSNGNTSASTSSERSSGSNSSSSSVGFSSNELSMVSDDNRNALIFYTSPAKYKSILPIIQQLDVLPAQVLVEAKFIEVTLTDSFSNGVEWAITDALNKTKKDPQIAFSNGSFTFNVSDLDYNFALNFLKQDQKVKVLSSPRVLVTDGKSASINVGTEVPVLSTQSNDVDTDRVLQSVQYRSTGVNLSITPTVNSRGIVSLQINQSVSESSENASSGLDSPVILNRSISTEVIAKSGRSIILGGLIRENNSHSDNGVPGLRDLPVVGNLFRSKSDSVTRTELVLVLTPRIIQNSSDLDEVSTIFEQSLSLFE